MAAQTLIEIGEIWYQRTHRLREVWEAAEVSDYKTRIGHLWAVMAARVLAVHQALNKAQQAHAEAHPFVGKPGGMPANKGGEYIIPPHLRKG